LKVKTLLKKSIYPLKINKMKNSSVPANKRSIKAILPSFADLLVLLIILAGSTSCNHHPLPSPSHRYQQVNLVSDTAGYGAATIDQNLKNAWGMAIVPSGPIWVSDNHTGMTTIYDATGKTLIPPITIPSADPKSPGAPTGQVYNYTPDFIIPSSMNKSKFIFAGEDGTISAWNSGSAAVIVADRSSEEAVYKGLTIAQNNSANYLYVANFKEGQIDVFDKDFKYVSGTSFNDPAIPSGFAPFNIENIGGMLYVTYAKQMGPDNEDDQPGMGNGYVDIFKPDGSLVKRFASQGKLNSPWGIAMAPEGFGLGHNTILIGNFGDGKINYYNSHGDFQGQLKDEKGKVIVIDGLWAITFPGDNVTSINSDWLFFTAGPNDEEHGLFGYLTQNLMKSPSKPGSY
jgi:uncharacterized protein (TIGR03118 family)